MIAGYDKLRVFLASFIRHTCDQDINSLPWIGSNSQSLSSSWIASYRMLRWLERICAHWDCSTSEFPLCQGLPLCVQCIFALPIGHSDIKEKRKLYCQKWEVVGLWEELQGSAWSVDLIETVCIHLWKSKRTNSQQLKQEVFELGNGMEELF